jgi:hypothetical protein
VRQMSRTARGDRLTQNACKVKVSDATSAEGVLAIFVFENCCVVVDAMHRMFMEGGGVSRRDQGKGSDGTVKRPFCVSLTRAFPQVTKWTIIESAQSLGVFVSSLFGQRSEVVR